MENNTISITIGEITISISSNNPNITGLINKIIELQNSINVDSIHVSTEDEKFDAAGFETVLKEATKEFLQEIKMETTLYESAKKEWKGEEGGSSLV